MLGTRRTAARDSPGRSLDETTRVLRAHLAEAGVLSAADRQWLRRRQRDLVFLYCELALGVIYLLLTVCINMMAMFWGFGLILVASLAVTVTELATGFYKHPQAANRAEYGARAAADQLIGNATNSAQSKFLGRHDTKE